MDSTKLKQLNQLMARLASEPGNEWMVKDFMKQVSLQSDITTEVVHPILLNIYEQCIEENVHVQAEEFYKNFPFTEIKPQMIGFMIKMEHERRQGDFDRFCLAMFQQLECLGNYSFNQKWIRVKTGEIKNRYAFQAYDNNLKIYTETSSGDELIAVLMNRFDNPSKSYYLNGYDKERYFQDDGSPVSSYIHGKNTWNILAKIKLALYLFFFNEKMKKRDFFELKTFLDELYAIRNKVHPEIKQSEKGEEVIKRVTANTSLAMTRFYGYLSKIIGGIHIPTTNDKPNQGLKTDIANSDNLKLKDGKAPKLGDEEKVIIDLSKFSPKKRF